MPELRPFTGLLYDTDVAGPLDLLTAPPYDVISPVDQERYYRASSSNVVRLILARPGGSDDPDGAARAARTLREWRAAGVLRETPAPSVYPFSFEFHLGGRRQTVRGLIAGIDVEPWGGSIVPHERTLPGPVADRLQLLAAVQANLSPIYAVLTDGAASAALGSFLDAAMAAPADATVEDDAGTTHRLWVCPDDVAEVRAALRRDRLMIADGHHRYTVALAYRERMRARLGPGPWDSVMALIVDPRSERPPVLPIHRVLGPGSAVPPPEGERVRDLAEVLATLRDDALTAGTVSMGPGGPVHRILQLHGKPPTVCALHEEVLDRRLASDLRFVPDAAAAEAAVAGGRSPMAYLLPPTTVERVWEVIGSGGKLPPKSTYFWPKPRTGLVIRPLDPREG